MGIKKKIKKHVYDRPLGDDEIWEKRRRQMPAIDFNKDCPFDGPFPKKYLKNLPSYEKEEDEKIDTLENGCGKYLMSVGDGDLLKEEGFRFQLHPSRERRHKMLHEIEARPNYLFYNHDNRSNFFAFPTRVFKA